jgi:adenylate cyclase class IV
MSLVIEKCKKIIDELNELTKGDIFPKAKKDEDNNIYFVGFLKLLKKPEEPVKIQPTISALESDDVNPDYEKYINDVNEYQKNLEIYNKLNEFVKLLIKDDEDFYSVLEKFGYEKWEEYKKRQKLHYIYNCQVGVEDAEGREHKFNIFDMSVFKAQIEAGLYPDENYYKNLPEWMIDIKNFTDLIIPYDCQTIYLFNPEKKAVVDLRKDELFLLPE